MKYLYILFLIIFFSCKDDAVMTPDPPPAEGMADERIIDTFLWEKVIDPETIQNRKTYRIQHTLIHEDNVIFYVPGMQGFVSLNLQDGATHWDLRGTQDGRSIVAKPLKNKSDVYYVRDSRILNLDLDNGQSDLSELWPIETEFQNVSISMYKNTMYGNVKEFGNSPAFNEYIMVPVDELVSPIPWTRFNKYTAADNDDIERWSSRPVFYQTKGGKDLMIYGSLDIALNVSQSPFDLVKNSVAAYDLNADTVVWQRDFLADLSGSSVNSILEEERMYQAVNRGLICLDVENNEVLWSLNETALEADISTGAGIHLYEDKLIAFGGHTIIQAFDKYTGAELWKLELGINDEDWFAQGSNKNTINYYNGRIYYMSAWGHLVSLDPNEGTIRQYFLDKRPRIEEYDVELFEPNFDHSTMVISDDGIVYTSEGIRFLAFEVPDKDL